MKKNKENWTGILLLSLTIIVTCQLQATRAAEWGWPEDTDSEYFGGYPLRSEVTCDDYPVTLQCPGTDVIKIVTAEYGRQSSETCSARTSEMRNTACMLPEAFDIMSKTCNNKTQCLLTVSSAVFSPDPCPDTKKYLTTMYNCVKYMFGCEGSLSGIGEEVVSQVSMQPQRGTWVKDPLYQTDHVFFAPFNPRQAQKLYEYNNWDDFLSGSPSVTYELRLSRFAEGNIVVFDRNLYYVEAESRSIVKYSLMSRFRLRKNPIQGQGNATGISHKDKIMLASDEKGLWAIYSAPSGNSGNIIISKLNKEDLSVMQSWRPLYSSHNVGHVFMMCGIAYFVGATTGTIDYSYNTNLVKDSGKRVPEIEFDAYRVPAFGMSNFRKAPLHGRNRFGSQSQRRSFLRYNTTSISYNPRDRLLYVWDMNGANAVYYKLHYNDHDPEKPFVRTTPKTTTTSTTRRRIPTTTKRPFTKVVPPIFPVKEGDGDTVESDRNTGIDFCDSVVRRNMQWPKTKAGDKALMPCSDGSQDYYQSWSLTWFYELPPPDAYEDMIDVATWTCVFDPSMRKAVWHVAGPDLSKCVTWATEIERRFDMGLIDNTEASNNLLAAVQQRTDDSEPLSDKVIITTSQVIKKLVDVKSFPSKEGAENLVKSVTKTSSYLISNAGSSEWKSMSDIKRTEVADDLMTSVEKAGFIYADTTAASPADVRDNEPLVVASYDILMRVEVRERTRSTPTSVTSFPSKDNLAGNWKDVSDVIQLSDSSIMNQRGVGPATVVFALYNNLGEFLTPTSSVWKPISAVEEEKKTAQWEIDSRIISASFRDTSYKAQLDTPAVIILEHKQESNHPHRCVYWDYSKSTESGNWSDTGCRRTDGNRTHTTCECNHLTSFAVLVNHAGVTIEPEDAVALDVITSVGISISIVCLIICIFTFSCFRNLRNDRNTIHIHLCICLLIAETIFLIGINQTQNDVLCAVIAGLLHYSFLAAFLWMALEGFQLYVMLVEVFEGHSRWKWYYLTGYGIPAVIVGISAGIDHTGYGTDDVCWLKVDTGFIWSFVGPVCVVILTNLVFLSITVYKMYVHTMTFSDSAKINSIKSAVRGASVLLCLLGITWAFGILWISGDMPVLAYLFCVFNAFQGMFIFIFHCLLPKKVRQEYTRCFNRFPCCGKMSRDTYVSNSMSFSKQYTSGRYSNGASAGTQQASLNRPSQLRRLWTETVAKPSESSTIVSDVNNVNTNRDNSRSAGCRVATLPSTKTSDQMMSNNQNNPARQQPPLPEDEVFLPTESLQDPRHQQAPNQQENMALLQNADDIHFDHLQRHQHHHTHHQHPSYHPDHFTQEHFHPGKHAPPLPRHHHSSTVAHAHGVHDHPHPGHFSVASYSQSHIHDILNDPNVDPRFVDRRFDHPGRAPLPYWTESPPGHQYQGSFEDAVNSAKRDSGISMQHPPNSMIHHPGDIQRPKIRRSQENIAESVQQDSDSSNRASSGFPASSRRYSNPVRNPDPNEGGGVHPPKYTQHHHRHDPSYSEDEHHQQCFENNEKQSMYGDKSHTVAGRNESRRSSAQNPMLIPLNERPGKAVTLSGGHRRRRSLASSESDDPIVTDCSVSSTGSSFGHPRTSLNRAGHNISEERYYEDESYHNRRLPVPPKSSESPREQWYKNKGDKLQRTQSPQEDENDLEVEMITAPENEIENSRVVSSVASSYQNQHGSSTPPSSSGHSPDDRYVISPPDGYKSLAGGNIYNAVGNQGDAHRQPNRELPVRYYNKNSDHNTHQEPYRYIQRENSSSRTEDMVDIGGLRMMTNL